MLQLLILVASCTETSNTDKWNAFLNYGIKNPVNHDYLVHVAFRNEADYPVNIFKTNFDETNDLVETTLQVGEARKLPCKVGDTFTAKVNSPGSPYDNLLLMAYDVSRVYLYERACGHVPLTICNRPPFTGDMRWTPPDSLMFSSLLNYNTSLYFWDGICEEPIANITTNLDYHIMSTLGHSFRVRNSNTEELLLEYKFEEIIIKGLEEKEYDISEKATAFFESKLLGKLKESIATRQLLVEEIENRMGKYC